MNGEKLNVTDAQLSNLELLFQAFCQYAYFQQHPQSRFILKNTASTKKSEEKVS